MKGENHRHILDYLAAVLMADMPGKLAVIRALHPDETLPDIKAVYINEEDANKIVLAPCLVIFSSGPIVLQAMAGAVLWEYPVDICAFDVPTAAGLPALHNRLYAYQGALTDLLLTTYGYAAGYWDEIRPLEPVDPQMLYERFGEIGRAEGYRFGIQVPLSYP